jgi:hypothetical protein
MAMNFKKIFTHAKRLSPQDRALLRLLLDVIASLRFRLGDHRPASVTYER